MNNDLARNEELTVKRSYSLQASTYIKIKELKALAFEDLNITYNQIVDLAIRNLYNEYKEKETNKMDISEFVKKKI